MRQLLENGLKQLQLPHTASMLDQLERYGALLVEWNEKMNLTAITQPEEIAVKHFLDSATCLCPDRIGQRVIDVGTGAGFPGLVLKILRPEIKLCLLDSLQKRLQFLQAVVDELRLEEVELVHARAEDGGREPALREQFDTAVARAVANLNVLAEYCLPFVKPGGSLIAMKGPSGNEEAAAAKGAVAKLGGEISGVETVILPNSTISHTVISIKKIRQTPPIYPRKAGKPSKAPLK